MMDEKVRHWEELLPDALGLIFRNLSFQEILTVIPRVCKSWNKAVAGPYCWQEIDIEEWSRRCEPEHLDRMLKMLFKRSSGSLRKLCISGLNDPQFAFIADNAGSLQTLRMPGSLISDSIVEQVAGRLSNITFLDISYCEKLGACALEVIGNNCKLLVRLLRMMHPQLLIEKDNQDDEAHAIAISMPKLKHLEMTYVRLTTKGVVEILSNCRDLELLDVRGCWDVKLDDDFLKNKCPGLKVLGPFVNGDNESDMWDEYSEYSDYPGFLDMDDIVEDYDDMGGYAGVWAVDQGFEELELRFYEGRGEFVDTHVGFGWPQSP